MHVDSRPPERIRTGIATCERFLNSRIPVHTGYQPERYWQTKEAITKEAESDMNRDYEVYAVHATATVEPDTDDNPDDEQTAA